MIASRMAVTGLLASALMGCGSPKADLVSPESQVETLVRAIEAGECDAVKQRVLTPSEIDCALIAQAEGTFRRSAIDLDEAEFTSSEPVNQSAVVTVQWNEKLPTERFEVQLVEGVWKIVFDSDA